MPGEQSAAEYYHYYLASQRRVERWVQRTDKELRAATGSAVQNSLDSSPAAAVLNAEKKVQEKGVQNKHFADELSHEELPQLGQHDHRRRSERTSSSSKHRTSDGRSHSRSQPSSGSKKIKTSRTSGFPAHPHHTKASPRHVNPRRESSRTAQSNGDITLFSYLPYGVLPVLYAITGSPALSVVVAILLLAVYLYMDYDAPATKKRSS